MVRKFIDTKNKYISIYVSLTCIPKGPHIVVRIPDEFALLRAVGKKSRTETGLLKFPRERLDQ